MPLIGSWNNDNIVFALAFNAWSKGNGIDQNTGEMPGYPNGSFNAIFTNMGTGFGFDKSDGVCKFDGVNDHIDTNHDLVALLTNAYKFTVEIKLNYVSDAGTQMLFAQSDGGTNNSFQIRMLSSDKISCIFFDTGVSETVVSTDTVSDGDHTIHFVKDGATLKIYLDGSEVSYDTQDSYTFDTISGGTNNVQIGIRGDTGVPTNSNQYWIALYDDAISEARILTNAGLGNNMGLFGINTGDVMSLAFLSAVSRTPIFVSATGSDTAPYDTKTKGANLLATAVNHFKNNFSHEGTILVDTGSYAGAGTISGLDQNLTIRPIDLNTRPEITSGMTLTFGANNFTLKGFRLTGAQSITSTGNITITDCLRDAAGTGDARIVLSNAAKIVVDHIHVKTSSTCIQITNCVDFLVEHVIAQTTGDGSEGLVANTSSTGTIRNSILKASFCIFSNNSSVVTSRHNFLVTQPSDNVAYITLAGGTIIDKAGDQIDVDPLFNDTTGVITTSSPAVRVGDPLAFAHLESHGGLGQPDVGRFGNTLQHTPY